jgi:hypothetical protein
MHGDGGAHRFQTSDGRGIQCAHVRERPA